MIREPRWLTYDDTLTLEDIRAMFVSLAESWMAATQASHEQGLLDKDRRLNQVFHLVTHGTHHRGQLLSMITLMGSEQPFEGGDFGGWSNA